MATNEYYNFTANVTDGTDVTLNWTITYENGQVLEDSGTDISQLLTTPGETRVTLTASNVVSDYTDTITILVSSLRKKLVDL